MIQEIVEIAIPRRAPDEPLSTVHPFQQHIDMQVAVWEELATQIPILQGSPHMTVELEMQGGEGEYEFAICPQSCKTATIAVNRGEGRKVRLRGVTGNTEYVSILVRALTHTRRVTYEGTVRQDLVREFSQ